MCWHCGKPGHKRSECQAYSTYLQAQPKGKGKGKGAGGDRALNEFHPDPGYADPEGGDLLGDPEELNAAEWYLVEARTGKRPSARPWLSGRRGPPSARCAQSAPSAQLEPAKPCKPR